MVLASFEKQESPEKPYYDWILMDVQMPGMDGYEATAIIRAMENPVLSHIPIIAFTANAFEEDRKRAMDCGMNAHVAKPLDINELKAAMQTCMEWREEI